jgi:hypothetical protein
MDILGQLTTYIPLVVLIGVFGITAAVYRVVPKDTDGKPPRWFLFVPIALGATYGIGDVLAAAPAVTPDQVPAAVHIGIRVIYNAIKTGIGYGGGAALAWEAKQKYLPGLFT